MKRTILKVGLAAAAATLAGSACAQSLTLNQQFLVAAGIAGQAPNAFCYVPTTNKCILATAATPVNAYIFDGTTGAASGNLNLTNIDTTADSLCLFALGTDAAGEIIGFSSGTSAFDIWSSAASNSTSASIAGSGNFVRNMDAADVATSAGSVTLLATSSGENDTDPSHLWQKVGGSFVNIGEVGSPADVGVTCCKAGTTISDDGQYIVGCSGSASTPLQGVYIFRNGTGAALNSINASSWVHTFNVDVGSFYGDVAIDASKDVGFGLKLVAGSPQITMFRLSTGAVLVTTPIDLTSIGSPALVGNARGGLDLDKVNQRLYVFFRFGGTNGDAGGDAAVGRFNYVANATAAHDWTMYQ